MKKRKLVSESQIKDWVKRIVAAKGFVSKVGDISVKWLEAHGRKIRTMVADVTFVAKKDEKLPPAHVYMTFDAEGTPLNAELTLGKTHWPLLYAPDSDRGPFI